MNRCVGWFLLGTIILLLSGFAYADPISGWHPSARDYFGLSGTGQDGSGASVPIIPMVGDDSAGSPAINGTNASIGSESVGILQTSHPDGARILVRYNTSEVSVLADVEIEGVALQEDLGASVPGLALYSARGKSEKEAVQVMSSLPGVMYAEPDYVWSVDRAPDDPEFWRQWGLSNTGQVYRDGYPPGTTGSDGKVLAAWDTSTSSGGVVVAVLDTGIDYTHPDLASNMWTGSSGEHGYNAISGSSDPMDDNGHGTHCAGIIGAVGNNGIGTSGAAWQTKLMGVKAIGSGGTAYVSDIIKGIEYTTQTGADIVSCSFGGEDYSQAVYDAIAASPALFVCAAGNSGKNNDINPHYPSSYSLSNIVGVAATKADDTLVSTSNYGTCVHLAAPGDQIYSTALVMPDGLRYTYMTGTSQATALVAGMFALILDLDTKRTPLEVKNLLIDNSDTVSALNGKVAANGRVNLSAVVRGTSGQDAITLHQGWNFVSVPRPLSPGSDTGKIFAGVSSGGHSVLEYINPDGWKTLKASDPISIMTGYWIYSTKEDSVPLSFASSPDVVRKQVQAGWNTYGLPLAEPIQAKNALSPIQSIWKYVVGYDASLQQYESPILNGGSGDQSDTRLIEPHQGYWLYNAGAGEITG